MPSNSPDAVIQAVLDAGTVAVVASLWLFDDSAYATETRRHLEGLIDSKYKSVVRLGKISRWREAAVPLFTAGFHSTIQPLTLLQHTPGLCFWIGEGSEKRMAEITQGIKDCDQSHPGEFCHVVIALGTNIKSARELQVLLQQKGAVVIVSEDGAVKHPLESLAQVSATYGYSVWCRFWQHPELNLVKAMWRPPTAGVLTLGFSFARIAVEHHTRRWQETLCWDQWQRWLKPHNPDGTRPETKKLDELLRYLLPEWYLAFAKESELPKLTISSGDGDERAMIAYLTPAEKPTSRNWWHRSQFREWMIRLRDHVDFLALIASANCRRFLERRARSLPPLLKTPLRTFLSWPRESEGMLGSFRGRLQLCISYTRALSGLRIAEDSQIRTSFEQDWKLALMRVSSIPHLAGALARWGLIAIGLSWLVIGPWIWLGEASPLTDRWLFYVTVSAAALLSGSIIGVICHHHYAAIAAANSIERASRNVEVRHLYDVGKLAIEKLRGAASVLQKQLQQQAEELDILEEKSRKQSAPVQGKAAELGPDRLTLAAVDRLIEPELDTMRKQLYANLGKHLLPPQGDQFIELDYEQWQKCLTEAALAVAKAQVSQLRYEDCAAKEADADSRLKAVLTNLVNEGGKPALPNVAADPCASVVLLGRRELWEPHRGHHDQVEFYPLGCRDLLVVSVHSLST